MKIKSWYCWVAMVVLLAACKEAYNPPLNSPVTGYLVVEGFINSGNGVSTIQLTRTTKLVDSIAIVYEDGAEVNIEDENNVLYPLERMGLGVYQSNVLSLNPALKYRLRIETFNGKKYVSDFSAGRQTPPVDSISWRVENGGVQIYANAYDPTNTTQYYQLKYSETWEFHSAFLKMLEYVLLPNSTRVINVVNIPTDTALYRCWKTKTPSAINLVSTEKLSDNKLFVPVRYIEPYGEELSVMYSIEVKQYALSREAYFFKQRLKKNTEQLGTIFDAQPSELGGNIHNVDDATEPVIGFVEVTSEQSARLFIRHGELADWPLRNSCIEIKFNNDPDEMEAGLIPTRAHEMEGLRVATFFAADPICVDCRLTGSNIKPPFWP